jgi:thiamine biosynthesis lipoprotein
MTDIRTQVRMVMGLPFSLHLGSNADDLTRSSLDLLWNDVERADLIFSTYRPDSDISRYLRGEIGVEQCDPAVQTVLSLADTAKRLTGGAFDINGPRCTDPSGLVKGWAAELAFTRTGITHGYLNAGGDLICRGPDRCWRIGIEHPADTGGLITVLAVGTGAIATSGRAHRGPHLWDPWAGTTCESRWQATVVGPELVWADVLATAAAVAGPGRFDRIDWPVGYHALLCDPQGEAYATEGLAALIPADIPDLHTQPLASAISHPRSVGQSRPPAKLPKT